MDTVLTPEQPENSESLIAFAPFRMTMLSMDGHAENALLPMEARLPGMVTVFNAVQPENSVSEMVVIPS